MLSPKGRYEFTACPLCSTAAVLGKDHRPSPVSPLLFPHEHPEDTRLLSNALGFGSAAQRTLFIKLTGEGFHVGSSSPLLFNNPHTTWPRRLRRTVHSLPATLHCCTPSIVCLPFTRGRPERRRSTVFSDGNINCTQSL